MVDKINNDSKIKVLNSDSKLSKKPLSSNNESENSSPVDSVSLSEVSKQVESLMAMIKNAPEINAARVAFLKGELDAGRYMIESSKIASKMVEETLPV